ncbi:MAG TPA: response regulator [Actinomycetota bacterium]|nr:response regulator [Actinomycetota bacterium]
MPLVLIVDDDEKNRRLAADVLAAAGFETIAAATGTEGVSLAAERAPDVILMDLRLPDMDGAEAARTLRAGEQTARIPVVAMSALSLEASGAWLEGAGFAGALEKPIRVATFPDQVRRFCVSETS